MFLNAPTLATVGLVLLGAIISTPVLYRGFARRGKGVIYEQKFLIQRAPQLTTLANVFIIVPGFLAANGILPPALSPFLTLSGIVPSPVSDLISWLGVALLVSGMVFMIGGWYSLGECFSTDAEVMDGHTVRKTGLLKYVMHPAYSGIIQCLLGSSLAACSWTAALFCVVVVAPLWLRRAIYEESLLLESLGPDYKKYAEELKWRRLVPPFIPIGV